MSDIDPATLSEAANLVRTGKVSSFELTLNTLDRAEATHSRLNAFIEIDRDGALQAARTADKAVKDGRSLGPLHGVPLAHKDMYDHAGRITGCGSKIRADHVASANASVIDRLEAAGTFSIGRLNMSEFAMGPTGHNHHYGRAINPIDKARITGGSSSGSGSAVGGGVVLAALGSDTGGSIRLPAACCGVVGIKPTQGRVPRTGVMPLSHSQDCVGPLATNVKDAFTILKLISGPDSKDATCVDAALLEPTDDISRIRIGIGGGMFVEGLTAEVADGMQDTIRTLGQHVSSISDAELPDFAGIAELANVVAMSEAAATHFDWMRERPSDYGPQLQSRLAQGFAIPAPIYLRALQIRARMLEDFLHTSFDEIDAIIVPAMPFVAPLDAEVNVGAGPKMNAVIAGMTVFTRPFSFLGLPVVTLPVKNSNGLPVAVQIVAKPWREDVAISVACKLETILAVGRFQPLETIRPAA
ncbi:aspartyl-tRNA(Asn)/glutamyl-tRNA(Gln) amidotransferase subunit A [Agrobacterium larrymoorei]|uniref:Indoleacetamide hydrolase n=1 Tax=Agrobacterium larrymoorei TaxID=160699 RepID=A0AAJ2ETM0_9HYPH|nr:amidase [Agrobacterium larrymoorei]MDR6100527.1 aspartyl-tRNA(Asn)/glutamyl-tRNA(Gln) amidotransferase subunit A [Agrobacterium larrymoorei]